MARKRLLDDCFLTDKERLTYARAIDILKQRLVPVGRTEQVATATAFGRVLASDVRAPRPIPAFDNAAVDGYAFRHEDYLKHDGHLKVSMRIPAGPSVPLSLPRECAARIFTGAAMPEGAETVAMREDCSTPSEDMVEIPPGLKSGANRRRAGEDQAEGAVVAWAGCRLRPQDLAAIAAAGLEHVEAYRPIRIAVASTGNEVVRPGAPLPDGGVYDSNHALLQGLIGATGDQATDLGILADTAAEVEATLLQAAADHDLILTTGGASRGEEDHLVETMEKIGVRHLWQLAIKPGRPMMFGQIGDTVVVSLPGNPVAVFVCYLLFAQPVISILSGTGFPDLVRYPLPALFAIPKKKPDRREFLRGILHQQADGTLAVDKFRRDGSGLISGLTASDGLIELPEHVTTVTPGETVSFIPYTAFGLPARSVLEGS